MLRGEHRARAFLLTYAQSSLGTGAAAVALFVIAYERKPSPWAITAVLLAYDLPPGILGPFVGALVDRVSRRWCVIAADLVRVGAFAGLAAVDSIEATVAFAFLAGAATALYRPAALAALPSLVPPDRLPAVTSIYGSLTDVGRTIGPALAAVGVPARRRRRPHADQRGDVRDLGDRAVDALVRRPGAGGAVVAAVVLLQGGARRASGRDAGAARAGGGDRLERRDPVRVDVERGRAAAGARSRRGRVRLRAAAHGAGDRRGGRVAQRRTPRRARRVQGALRGRRRGRGARADRDEHRALVRGRRSSPSSCSGSATASWSCTSG